MLFDTDSYLCLAATAKFERYEDRQYINPDWTSEPSTDGSFFSRNTTWGIVRPFLNFKLGIGGWWWNGSAWTQTETSFWVKCRTEEDEDNPEIPDGGNWNQDREILNNIPFSDWTGADGYKIPLNNNINPNAEITFCVNMPIKLAFVNVSGLDVKTQTSGQNHWCWISGLKLTIHNKLSREIKDSDIVYGGEENGQIDANSVMELSDVDLKITTYPEDMPLSYSHVGVAGGGFLTGIIENSIVPSYTSRKPEENLIRRYIHQYSTQTIKEELVVGTDITPFQKIYDAYWTDNKHFVWNGTTINLAQGNQTIKIVETK